MIKKAEREDSAEEKIKRLFLENYGKWISYAAKCSIEQSDAEDIIQSLVLRLLENKDRLELLMKNELEAYAMQSLKNAIKSHATRTKPVEPLQEEFPSEEETAEQVVLTHLEYDSIKEAVKELSEAQREIIHMNFYLRMGISEIAQKLGMTDGTVRVYKSRAVKTLRKILANVEIRG